jgi:hypothetical protein
MSKGMEAKILVWTREFRSWSILIDPGLFFVVIYLREYVHVLLTVPGVAGNSNRAIKIGYLKVKKNRTREIGNLTWT